MESPSLIRSRKCGSRMIHSKSCYGYVNMDLIIRVIHADLSTQKIEVLESRLLSNPLHNSPRLPDLYEQYAVKVALGTQIKDTKKKIAEAQSILQLDELKNRKRVLRRFGFINEAEVVQLKARVAWESSTGDEWMLSEL